MTMSRSHASTPSIAITALLATTPIIDKSGHPWGRIFIPAGSSITTLTFYDRPHDKKGVDPVTTDDYFTAKDKDNAAVTMTVAAGCSYPFPEAIAASPNLKIVGDAAGSIILSIMG